ncbi:hypothetical protein ACJX0J_014924, partial [Zea mays]
NFKEIIQDFYKKNQLRGVSCLDEMDVADPITIYIYIIMLVTSKHELLALKTDIDTLKKHLPIDLPKNNNLASLYLEKIHLEVTISWPTLLNRKKELEKKMKGMTNWLIFVGGPQYNMAIFIVMPNFCGPLAYENLLEGLPLRYMHNGDTKVVEGHANLKSFITDFYKRIPYIEIFVSTSICNHISTNQMIYSRKWTARPN